MRRGLSMAMVAGLTVTAGCSGGSGSPAAPRPVGSIEAARFYTGRWYEIARTPMKLTDGCVAGTTDYFRRPDGQLMDRDACRDGTPQGKEKVYQGPVTILDTATNAKVSVRYTLAGVIPVAKTYWMLEHDPDYRWFIVSDPAFDMVSIFTRAPRPGAGEVHALTARAAALGYDTGKLEYPEPFPAGRQ